LGKKRYSFNPYSSVSISKAIDSFISLPKKNRLQKNSGKILSKFSFRKMARETLSLYKEYEEKK
jgi:glycosyltransferase involved in cell wall biosynthesis